jgi:hypothetical protein
LKSLFFFGIWNLKNLEFTEIGGLAQLARAPALHAGGQRFDSVILHKLKRANFKLEITNSKIGIWNLKIGIFFEKSSLTY